MAMSHANCTHPRTPAGRRACRAGNAAAPVVIAPTVVPTSPGLRHPEIKWTAAAVRRAGKAIAKADAMRADRDKARQAAAAAPRIQGRRIPSRVVRDGSGCIQASLHTSGRCACGWHAENFCNPAVWACAGH